MKYRNFSVTAVLNGFIIEIGCQKAVASSAGELVELITEYMKDPGGMETKMMKQSFSLREPDPVMREPVTRERGLY